MTISNHVYAVILAGGSGTRFWPGSRKLKPKQLCHIGNEALTMIEKTLARLDGFIPEDRRIIVTHKDQLAETKRIVGARCRHFIAEPEAKNTAAALTIAALEINHLCSAPEPVMISLHADHIIENEVLFRDDLRRAVGVAEQGHLTLLGVKPRYAETGYGYIEQGPALPDASAFDGFRVASFREKPDIERAKHYVSKGNFYWNSGYFIWRTSVILSELKRHLPTTLSKLQSLNGHGTRSFTNLDRAEFAGVYESLPKIAIDNAILEVSTNVAVVATDFGWYDIGSWDALTKCFPTDEQGNYKSGDLFMLECEGTTIQTDGPFVAAIGVKNMVIVSTKDAILVCPKDRAQDVKKVVEFLHAESRSDLI